MAEDPNCPENKPDYRYEIAGEDSLFGVQPSSSSVDETDGLSEKCTDQPDTYCYSYDQMATMCNRVGLSPEMIDGILIQLMIQHFSDPSTYIYSKQLSQVYYRSDPNLTKMWIHFATTYKGDKTGDPALIFNNLGQVPKRLAIDDLHYHSSLRPEAVGYARAYTGQHRIMCLGQTDGQAEVLASEAIEWLTTFSPRLRRDLPFFDFQVGTREQPRLYEDMGNRVGVAFGVSYSYIWAWELIPAGPPLKAITVTKDT